MAVAVPYQVKGGGLWPQGFNLEWSLICALITLTPLNDRHLNFLTPDRLSRGAFSEGGMPKNATNPFDQRTLKKIPSGLRPDRSFGGG